MKIAFFDLSSGIAGDMIISSLLSAGLNFDLLKAGLVTLGVTEYEFIRSVKKRSSLEGVYIDVRVKEKDHKHEHHDGHSHSHTHDHSGHRHLKTIVEIIESSELPGIVKQNAIKVFKLLGEAEAKVHGVSIEKIHFHEVGAVDSIVDIVGGCLGLHLLGIDQIFFNSFHFGKGSVHCAHGDMPIPVPATVRISSGYDCIYTDVEGELTTPTGAAMMAALGSQVSNAPNMKTLEIGYGAGANEYQGVMGLLRVILGEKKKDLSNHKKIYLIETNIDDMSSEILSSTCEKLLQICQQDVWTESIYMKKGRVGHKICILCDKDKKYLIEEMLFQETSTFGYRYQLINKVECDRKFKKIALYGETIRVKIKIFNGEEKCSPEFEDCQKIATKKGLALQDVYQQVLAKINHDK